MQNGGEWQNVQVEDGSAMRIYVARPAQAKAPGMLVLQEAFGVNGHIRKLTERISAELGVVAASPELYHRIAPGFEGDYKNTAPSLEHMKEVTDDQLEADLRAAHAWFQQDAQTESARIAAVGYCMGGRVAFLANAVLPLKAAVSYYGGRIAPSLLPRASELSGNALFFWGGKDKNIGREQQNAVAEALRKTGKRFVDVEFSEAGHAFFCDERENYNAEAANQSWALMKAFLEDNL